MTLLWAQVVLILLGTVIHIYGRAREVRINQHSHYIKKWDEELRRLRHVGQAWYDAGELEKANETLARARCVNKKYQMFFDSLR